MINYVDIILCFSIYSFLGWALETLYASIRENKFINRGFLTGFFCPIYGFGAIIIITASKWITIVFKDQITSLINSIIISVLLVTLLEYITGYILEKVFNFRWWDYSNEALNLHGYICFKYSMLWGLLALLLVKTIHSVIIKATLGIPILIRNYLSFILMIYFIVDTSKSIICALDLRETIQNYTPLTVKKYNEKIVEFKRLFEAFPHLRKLKEDLIHSNARSLISARMVKIKIKLKSRFL